MTDIRTQSYYPEAIRAIGDKTIQKALASLQMKLRRAAQDAYERVAEDSELRQRGRELRREAIDHLDILLATLAQRVRANGGEVYFAANAADAVAYCLKVARQNKVRCVVKGKSMVTEEIGVNQVLADDGIEVVETDLGEYIVQLAGDRPSHIIAPAAHKTKEGVGKLFAQKLGQPYSNDPPTLTRMARSALREKFLAADMGITGCNLACAETGHIATLSNEGNIRMVSTLPRIHIAIMGMERVAAHLEDHDILLRLLSHAATGQPLAGYVSYVGGPRKADHADGPEAFHLIILDNGRSRILADPEFREILYCIRCAACLNVCPVYGSIGGHAYGFPYSGPVGAVVTPLLVGVNRAKDLCQGETLCGACQESCPIHIDIPRMLVALRRKLAEGDRHWQVRPQSLAQKTVFAIWSHLMHHRRLYDIALQVAAFLQHALPTQSQRIRRLPYPFSGWTQSRDLPFVAPRSFIHQCKYSKTSGRKR